MIPSAKRAAKRLLPVLAAASALLTGCGGVSANYRPLEQLRLVQVLGYDAANAGISLSVATGKLGENDSAEDKPLRLCQEAGSVSQAVHLLQDAVSQGQLLLAHTQYAVLGRAAAERDMAPLLDYVERDAQLRMNTGMFVLTEGEAKDLLLNEETNAAEAFASLRQDVAQHCVSHVYRMGEIAVALSETGAALVGTVRVLDTGEIVPEGYGILKDAKLVGEIAGEDAETLSMLLGYPGAVIRTIPVSGGAVTLRVTGSGEIRPIAGTDGENAGGEPAKIRLRLQAAIIERSGDPPEDAGALERVLAASLAESIQRILSRAKETGADFLSLSRDPKHAGAALEQMRWTISTEAVIDKSNELLVAARTDGGQDGEHSNDTR